MSVMTPVKTPVIVAAVMPIVMPMMVPVAAPMMMVPAVTNLLHHGVARLAGKLLRDGRGRRSLGRSTRTGKHGKAHRDRGKRRFHLLHI
jgi:hypothetical protein